MSNTLTYTDVLVQIIQENNNAGTRIGDYSVAIYPQEFATYTPDDGMYTERNVPLARWRVSLPSFVFVADSVTIDLETKVMKITGDRHNTKFFMKFMNRDEPFTLDELRKEQEKWYIKQKDIVDRRKRGLNILNLFRKRKYVITERVVYDIKTSLWVAREPDIKDANFEFHYKSMEITDWVSRTY